MQVNPTVKNSILHSFHILTCSPWPPVIGFTSFFFVFGLTGVIHNFNNATVLFKRAIFLILFGFFHWCRDVVREATMLGDHTSAVQAGLRSGWALFIVSEIRLFSAFFWAQFSVSLVPMYSVAGVLMFACIIVIDPWFIPGLNTILLLTSGISFSTTQGKFLVGSHVVALVFFVYTLTCATAFTMFQAYEYCYATFSISDGAYGSCFYMLTGLHGFHVFVGTLLLLVAGFRRLAHHFTLNVAVGFECAGWYWHFVDVVWLFLFVVLYIPS